MKKKKFNWFSLLSFVIMFVVIFATFKFVVFPIRVQGESMMNALLDQELGIMNIWQVKQNGVERFDIVVIHSKELEEDIIKRIIGLPGEDVEYKNDKLYINGKYIEEPFLDRVFAEEEKAVFDDKLFTEDFHIKLKKGEYFAMGDNRLNSMDSRVLGTFTMKDIKAKNGYIIYPFNRMGPLKE